MTLKEAELDIEGFHANKTIFDLSKDVIVAVLRDYGKDCSDLTDDDKEILKKEIAEIVLSSINSYLEHDLADDLAKSIVWWFHNFHVSSRGKKRSAIKDIGPFPSVKGIKLADLMEARFPDN